ncbi:MAG: TIGR04211 family SH3 domain-containing protein [Methyloprofundus sp.]|nr:TIGR04211 family SH3 domain-containing protein [Methyloprofundus sp.]
MKFTLRSGESSTHKIIRMLGTGTKLSLLGVDKDTGYSHVQTSSGVAGYIPTRFTLNKPIGRWYLDKANKQVETLKAENVKIKTTLTDLQQNNSSAVSSNTNLTQERDQLRLDLTELQQTASNAIQLQRQRNELQERVVNVERELQQIKRAKQALEDSTSQDWFLYGGILSFLGILFGLLIPKISWHRKSQGNWDTF